MDVILALILTAILFITSVFKHIDTLVPLVIVLFIFICLSVKKGVPLKITLLNAYNGSKKSIGVLQVFILIGAIVSIWMMSGTVPSIVYYGIKLISPNLFIISAFILTSIVSLLIGTSFGTSATIGISLMVMARAGGANLYIVAGAILSGALLGDRNSPMSSSANLIASITKTNIYDNMKNMVKTSIIPIVLTCIIYGVLSYIYPVNYTNSSIVGELNTYFNINIIVLLPALIIIVLSLFKVEVKISMILSIITASIIAFTIQHQSVIEILKTIFFGFELSHDNPLYAVIKGGGVLSMLKLSLIVFMSSALIGLFEGANMLSFTDEILNKVKTPTSAFLATIIASIVSSIVGCTQVLAVMLTHITMDKTYKRLNFNNNTLALDLENTAIVIAPLVPWNIAGLVPLTNLGVGYTSVFFAFYLVLVPLITLGTVYIKSKTLNRDLDITA